LRNSVISISSAQGFVGTLFRAQHEQAIGVLDQHPVHEQTVDPIRVLERFAQAMAGLEIQGQRNRAKLKIQVDQHDLATTLTGDQPCETRRHHGRPDSASGAGNRDQLADPGAGLDGTWLVRRGRDRFVQQTGRDWLDQVVGHAVRQKIAEHAAIVAITKGDHGDAGLADIRQAVDVRQRQLGFAEIDQQQVGRAVLAQVFHRFLDAAFTDRGLRQHHLTDDLIDHGVGVGVGAEGEKLLALRIGVQLLSGCKRGCHYCPSSSSWSSMTSPAR
jgi:hypothetical protein